jgi:DNA repair protein RadC
VSDDNWQAELPVGDTGRVFDTVATRSASLADQPHQHQAYFLNKSGDCDFSLDSSHHPSGDPVPGPEDMELTRRLAAAGVLMGIDAIDHVVLGDVRYWSFKEAGRL